MTVTAARRVSRRAAGLAVQGLINEYRRAT